MFLFVVEGLAYQGSFWVARYTAKLWEGYGRGYRATVPRTGAAPIPRLPTGRHSLLWLIDPVSARNTLTGMEAGGFQHVSSQSNLGLLAPSSGPRPIPERFFNPSEMMRSQFRLLFGPNLAVPASAEIVEHHGCWRARRCWHLIMVV